MEVKLIRVNEGAHESTRHQINDDTRELVWIFLIIVVLNLFQGKYNLLFVSYQFPNIWWHMLLIPSLVEDTDPFIPYDQRMVFITFGLRQNGPHFADDIFKCIF